MSPLVQPSGYRPPFLMANGHLQTVYPALCRRVSGVAYRRERIPTPDGDFLDLDWSEIGARRLAVITHGLAGSSARNYMRGMARAFNAHGWDALAWNLRGCGGEPNRTIRLYHSGASNDLETVIRHAESLGRHDSLALVGFSLGGNITLRYAGEQGSAIPRRIAGVVTFSVPCDLAASAHCLEAPSNRPYMRYFLRSLRRLIRAKMAVLPGMIDDIGYERIRTFRQFDDRYTAPLHGFKDAAEYYARCSCRQFLGGIRVPTLLVNARNDPFLNGGCYPVADAEANPWFHLEIPASGGHVGFITFDPGGIYWSERRALEFLAGQGRSAC